LERNRTIDAEAAYVSQRRSVSAFSGGSSGGF
jgi:hypothetical protein